MKLRDLLIRRDDEAPEAPGKAEKRVQALPTHDLVPWAEQCLNAVGRNLIDWSRDVGRVELLYEAREGAQALLLLTEELVKRGERLTG